MQSFLTGSFNHWVCIHEVHIMDSLATTSIGDELVLQMAKIYKGDDKFVTVRRLSVQQQIGKLDCGLFAVAYAMEVCMGNKPATVTFNQMEMRPHLYRCLERGIIDPFPKITARKTNSLRAAGYTFSAV